MLKKSLLILTAVIVLTACGKNNSEEKTTQTVSEPSMETQTEAKTEASTKTNMNNNTEAATGTDIERSTEESTQLKLEETAQEDEITSEKISLDPSWKYAEYSEIHSGSATLYRHNDNFGNGVTVCINAGHGTKGGESVKTLCHPDGSPKVTGGTTSSGATKSYAISSGMMFPDGTSEAEATLSLAMLLKEKLLESGYNILMIREDDDAQLDNIARTVLANNMADCHIALHYDYTENDKGVFYLSVPEYRSYREMEPVKSHWKEHHALGDAVIYGMKTEGVDIFSDGQMEMDLTQTSFSTIPSIDLEVGDAGSDLSEKAQMKLAEGVLKGLNRFYKKGAE